MKCLNPSEGGQAAQRGGLTVAERRYLEAAQRRANKRASRASVAASGLERLDAWGGADDPAQLCLALPGYPDVPVPVSLHVRGLDDGDDWPRTAERPDDLAVRLGAGKAWRSASYVSPDTSTSATGVHLRGVDPDRVSVAVEAGDVAPWSVLVETPDEWWAGWYIPRWRRDRRGGVHVRLLARPGPQRLQGIVSDYVREVCGGSVVPWGAVVPNAVRLRGEEGFSVHLGDEGVTTSLHDWKVEYVPGRWRVRDRALMARRPGQVFVVPGGPWWKVKGGVARAAQASAATARAAGAAANVARAAIRREWVLSRAAVAGPDPARIAADAQALFPGERGFSVRAIRRHLQGAGLSRRPGPRRRSRVGQQSFPQFGQV